MTITALGFAESLQAFMEKWDLNNGEVANVIGAHPNSIFNYLSGNTKPHKSTLSNYVRKMREYDESHASASQRKNYDTSDRNSSQVLHESRQLYSLGAGGSDTGIPGYDLETALPNMSLIEILKGTPLEYIKVPGNERATFAILNRGDAMYKKYNNGDWLPARVVDDYDDLEFGRCYLVVTGQTRVVRRVLPGDSDDIFLLVAENESMTASGKRKFPDYHVKKESIKGMAMICGGVKLEDI